MTPRENLLRALRRDNPEWVPLYFSLCEELKEQFKERTGTDDYLAYYDIPVRFIAPKPSLHPVDYSKYYPSLPENTTINEIGVAKVAAGYKHFSQMLHAMENFTTPEEVWAFPLPDTSEAYRWEGVADEVKRIQESGYAAMFSAIQVFEYAWYLRGLDNLLCDMMADEEMAAACLDRMTQFEAKIAARVAETGVDIIVFGDDVGTQKDLMMSPELWRKWIKPTTAAVIKAAKEVNPDVICYYHSDGNIYAILEELIEIGVDVLNPIQPECMDPVRVKEIVGDRMAFWGTIGTQTTMPFGAPSEVEHAVKQNIETVGKDGGLVIAPTHLLEPEVPWGNIEMLVAAVKKHGRYVRG